MSQGRRYRLLCPIARGLDRVGDRWTLLILRDLHAGPARFTDLASGLPGLATNLLTDRLRRLETDGFIRRRRVEFGITVYELTELGDSTGGLLFSLAQIGSRFSPDEVIKRPDNLRSVVVTIKESLRAVVDSRTQIRAGLMIDDEAFEIVIADGKVNVLYRQPIEPEVTIATSYEPLMASGDGAVSPEEFVSKHVRLVQGDPQRLPELLSILGMAFKALSLDSPTLASE